MSEFVLVLHFDHRTERKLRGVQEALQQQGMNLASGVSYVRPHITLASFTGIAIEALAAHLRTFVAGERALVVGLEAVGTFPGDRGVVYIAPVVTGELLGLHKRLLDSLQGKGAVAGDFYRPARWMPHCTMALNLAEVQIAPAVDLCRKSEVFGPAELVEVALINFPAGVEVGHYLLGD